MAGNFVKTLKAAIKSIDPSTLTELDRSVDNFLLQYRNADQSSTGNSPASLFKGRRLNTTLNCISNGEVTFFKGNDLCPSRGVVLGRLGNKMVTILDLDDFSNHRRHVDQIRFDTTEAETSDCDATDSTNTDAAQPEIRRSQRLQFKARVDYRHPGRLPTLCGCDSC